jgi:Ca2+-binding EF-hand superfamily protein
MDSFVECKIARSLSRNSLALKNDRAYTIEYTSTSTSSTKEKEKPQLNYEQSEIKSNQISSSIFASSALESAISLANSPLEFKEKESITVNGNTGVWLNKEEILNWKGDIPITEYSINEDSNPEIIRKQTDQKILCKQEVAVRYLRPPTPPPPGEIIIREEKNFLTAPAPPLVIRQVPPRPETPVPLILREVPPKQPVIVGKKIITISGKRLPPPPRKVVIERLAQLPKKPQAVIVERWLPYTQSKRKVIFQKNTIADPVIVKPRNVIIQWDTPTVEIKKDFKDLGIIRADPAEYIERYGNSLISHLELPQFVKEIKPPFGLTLAAEYQTQEFYELEGDIEALRLIDLDKEGLIEYKSSLEKNLKEKFILSPICGTTSSNYFSNIAFSKDSLLELFESVNIHSTENISKSDVESIIFRLNSRLGRHNNNADLDSVLQSLNFNVSGFVSFEQFRRKILSHYSKS